MLQETNSLESEKKRLENEVETLKKEKSDLQFIIGAHIHSPHCHVRSSTVDLGVPMKTESAYAAGNRKPSCASFQSPSSKAFQSNDLPTPGAVTALNPGSTSSLNATAREFSSVTLSSGCQVLSTVSTGIALPVNSAGFKSNFHDQPGRSYLDSDTWFEDKTSWTPVNSTSSEASDNIAYGYGIWPNIAKSL